MGIFDQQKGELFNTYRCGIEFRDKIMGGIPMDPNVIKGWLTSKMGLSKDAEIVSRMAQTLRELGADLPDEPTIEDMNEAAELLANTQQSNGFKRDENGLYIEGRQVKAMLKEVTNILFAGQRWGKTRKGPKGFLAERVFPEQDRIYLGRDEADGAELFVGHVSGPQGMRSTLTYYQYVERAHIEFDVLATKDADEEIDWPILWLHAQENGLGALRSQGHGRFDVVQWDLVTAKSKLQKVG